MNRSVYTVELANWFAEVVTNKQVISLIFTTLYFLVSISGGSEVLINKNGSEVNTKSVNF